MVFLGFQFHFRISGSGILHCYRCGGDRQYRGCSGRRWIHVFFVPVVPLDRVAEHLQCTTCGTRYRTEVLALPTAEQMLAALPVGTRAAVTMMVAAGDSASSRARASAIEVVRQAGLDSYDEAALAADLAGAGGDDRPAAVAALARQLTMPAHEWFLADVVRVGLADGQLSAGERRAARQIAACLGMGPAQAHGVIVMTEESAAAG